MTEFLWSLRAEWTKFRTVRGWVVGVLVGIGVTVLIGLLGPLGSSITCNQGTGRQCTDGQPTGPGGEAVLDSFYFVHQPMSGDGSVTARITGFTGMYPTRGTSPAGPGASAGMAPGLVPWSKAGIIVKDGTKQGSTYAAVLVTGDHGVRMQYDFTHDTAGADGSVSAASPRWLRLTRSGPVVTGYDSVDGTRWQAIGSATLPGLPATAQVGLFVTSPRYTVITQTFGGSTGRAGPTQATAVFDHVRGPSGDWAGTHVATDGVPGPPVGFAQAGGTFTVTGSGDIAPDVTGPVSTVTGGLTGVFGGLIALIVVAAMFVTGEYRYGLILATLTAGPRRGRMVAAKATVVASVTFVAGLVACTAALRAARAVDDAKGNPVVALPVGTEVRIVVGSAALLAVAAVLALAVGMVVRSGAVAVAVGIVGIVLPYILAVASVLPAGAAEWLTRVTPAAAFAVQQTVIAYPQVTASYTPDSGYFPLPPWGGFGVLCAYAVVALGIAGYLVRRRDA